MKKLKKILLPLATAILVIAISIGATLAYLMDEATADNVMTIGKVDIELLEYERINTETKDADANVQEFRDNKPLLPAVIEKGFDYTPGDTYVDWTQDAVEWQQQNDDDGYTSPIWDPAKISNEVDKMVFLKNSGDYGAYVRIYFAFEAGNFDTFNEFREMIHLNLNETDDWKWEWIPFLATNAEGGKYFIANATYQKVLQPGDFTEISLSQIALDPSAENKDVAAFGDTYEVFVNAQGIQSAGFKDPDTALDEGFGRDIPFEKLTLVAGIDLKTALHNLNGDESKPITDKVATVTFGLNETYPNIVKDNVGTFTSVEQDAMVYTYYVPNAADPNKYDIYVLADDTIYTPKNSKGLFSGMSALTTVDTTNMDVSRTENMYTMFYKCEQLTSIDVSNWNTENVTDMGFMFSGCSTLESLAVDDWEVGNVTNMMCTFQNAKKLIGLNVANWEVANVNSMRGMFQNCVALTYLNVSNWDVGNVTLMDTMFENCSNINNLDVSGWNVANVTNMGWMFYGCTSLTALDVDEWDVGKVTTFHSFLNAADSNVGSMKLSFIDVSDWNTSSVTDMNRMFYGCGSLTKLDLSGWDVRNVTDMDHIFADCFKLAEINFEGWETLKLENADAMFNDCNSITVIDVSDFDTQNLKDVSQMFEGCDLLERIEGLDEWDTRNIHDMYEMFSGDIKLTTLDLSAFDTSSLSNAEKMFNNCSAMKIIYVGDGWNMSNVTDSADMFTGCTSIKGESGTVYDAANANDVTYANTETGYLTYKAAPTTNP